MRGVHLYKNEPAHQFTLLLYQSGYIANDHTSTVRTFLLQGLLYERLEKMRGCFIVCKP